MLGFFKINNPSIVFFNILLLLIAGTLAFLFPIDIIPLLKHDEPFAQLLSATYFALGDFGYPLYIASGLIILFSLSLLINNLSNLHKLSSKKTYIGGVIFICYCCLLKPAVFLSPILMALLFLVLLFNDIFALAKQEKQYGQVFNLGFHSMMATLFYFPAIIFVIISLIGLIVVRSNNIKEGIIFIMGLLAPLLIVFTVYFWQDNLAILPFDLININNKLPLYFRFIPIIGSIMIAAAMIFIWSFINVQYIIGAGSLVVRKYTTIILFSIVLLIISYFFQTAFHTSHAILLAFPMSLIVFLYFIETKSTIITEILFILLILLLIVAQVLQSLF